MCKAKLYKNGKPNSRIDKCMRGLIKALNEHGIETLACCCGHGKYPMTIVYRYSRNDVLKGNIYDFISGWGILGRKRKFYKRDSKGYYYIPEVVTPFPKNTQ